jgi:hypothetical protein
MLPMNMPSFAPHTVPPPPSRKDSGAAEGNPARETAVFPRLAYSRPLHAPERHLRRDHTPRQKPPGNPDEGAATGPPLVRRATGAVQRLASAATVVAPSTPVAQIKHLLDGKSPFASIVVADMERPLGLLMSYKLDRILSTQFGRALYFTREVANIMDVNALIAEGSTQVGELAAQAMHRGDDRLYDDVIIVKDGRLEGVVSVQAILSDLARVDGILQTTGAVCHEFNQPLQIILSHCELGAMSSQPVLSKELVACIVEQVQRMQRITARLQSVTECVTRTYTQRTSILDIESAASRPYAREGARGLSPEKAVR